MQPKSKVQQQFSVTSSETGLRLKIAAIPNEKKKAQSPKIPVPTAAAKKGNFGKLTEKELKIVNSNKAKIKKKPLTESSSSSDGSCSDCSSSSDSEVETKKPEIPSPRRNLPARASKKTGPKLSATVYSKSDTGKSDEVSKDAIQLSSAEPSEKVTKSSRTVKKIVAKRKTRSVEKLKTPTKTPAKRPRGRPKVRQLF